MNSAGPGSAPIDTVADYEFAFAVEHQQYFINVDVGMKRPAFFVGVGRRTDEDRRIAVKRRGNLQFSRSQQIASESFPHDSSLPVGLLPIFAREIVRSIKIMIRYIDAPALHTATFTCIVYPVSRKAQALSSAREKRAQTINRPPNIGTGPAGTVDRWYNMKRRGASR